MRKNTCASPVLTRVQGFFAVVCAKTYRRVVLSVVFVLPLLMQCSSLIAAMSYSGEITTAQNQIDGSGLWLSSGSTRLLWLVSQNVNGSWHYSYTLSVGKKGDISHFILETSKTFTCNDIFNAKGAFRNIVIDTFNLNSGSNPNMPSEIYGIKFDNTYGTNATFSFDSYRMPVWGDFYAKGGNAVGEVNTVYNSGFAAKDPVSAPHDGANNCHILVPDTYSMVPEPAGILGLAASLTSLAGYLARRRK